jgi:hypothetical protein
MAINMSNNSKCEEAPYHPLIVVICDTQISSLI